MKLPEYTTHNEKKALYSYVKVDTKDVLDFHLEQLPKFSPNCIFRGVNEAKYKIYSSAQREWISKGLGRHFPFEVFIENLLQNIRQNTIISDYYKSLNIYKNDILYLSLLQHYSAPTPLIDFTRDYQIALYFATNNINKLNNNEIDDYISLYYMDLDKCGNEICRLDNLLKNGLDDAKNVYEQYKSNHHNVPIDKSLLDKIDEYTKWKKTDGTDDGLHKMSLSFIDIPQYSQNVITPFTNEILYWSNLNLIAQKGCFLMYNNTDEPLEEYVGRTNRDIPKIWCLDIHKSLSDYIRKKYCYQLSEDTLFPNLKELANDAYLKLKQNL